MEYIIIGLTALLASGLTLFSGFGLGSLLLPVFAIFFATDIAIALTAIVHFSNNLFKLGLLGKHTHKTVALRFGLPAICSAFIGALLLKWLTDLPPLLTYQIFSASFQLMPVNLIIGLLMIIFVFIELSAYLKNFTLRESYLPLGGTLSGFFGGLSGHQGALRSMFLLHCGLSKESFIATGIAISCLVDISRLLVYSDQFSSTNLNENSGLLTVAVLSAFMGAFIGRQFFKKVTMWGVQIIVSIMLFLLALGLILGII